MTVYADISGERMDAFLARTVPELSRSAAQKLLEDGCVLRCGKPGKKNDKLNIGDEHVRRQRRITVKIPAGIDNGQAISLRGQGGAGANGGPAGDLVVQVNVRPHPKFRRDGTTVLLEQPISFLQAALGDELTIDTIDGPVKYTLPEGTQTGTTFRLRGKGIPTLNGRGRGDQYVTVTVQTPTRLTQAQKEAMRAFGEAMGELKKEDGKDSEKDTSKTFFDKKKKKK